MKKSLIILSCLALSLSACGKPKDEKDSYIQATVEAMCLVFKADNVFDPNLENETKKIYEEYGFNVEDETEMDSISAKYENDKEVQDEIMAGLQECGGDLFTGLKDLSDSEAVPEETVLEAPELTEDAEGEVVEPENEGEAAGTVPVGAPEPAPEDAPVQ